MLTVERGTYSKYKDELKELFAAHAEEIVTKVTPDLKLKIDDNFYLALEQANRHLAIVIKKAEECIGYLSILVYNHPHHVDNVFAITDCFYVNPKYRGVSSFKAVLNAFELAEKILKNEYQAEYFYIGISAETDLSYLMGCLNCKRSDIVYVKNLAETI